MAKLTLNTIGSRYASVAALNNNFDLIETALENTLSRNGLTPNFMEAPLDMNSRPIINVGRATEAAHAVRYDQLLELITTATGQPPVVPITWQITSTGASSYTLPLLASNAVDMYLVSVNGSLIPPSTYTVDTATSTIFFTSPPAAAASIVVRLFGSTTEASATSVTVTGTKASVVFDIAGAETTFNAGSTLSGESTDVFLNGTKLLLTRDYTVSGTNVVLNSSANAGDVLEVVTYTKVSVYVPSTVGGGPYEPADATILKSSHIGVTVQGFSANLGTWASKTPPTTTVVGVDDTQTLTAKTISLSNNTLTGTKAEFDTAVSDGNICYDGDSVTNLTMNTARILGRSTAGSGAVEEITVGSGLTLSGGTLSSGDVVGPASATNNAIVRFDGTTGKLVQNSVTTVEDTGQLVLGGTGTVITSTASTTSTAAINLQNSLGRVLIGVDSNTGGSLATGSTAYAAVVNCPSNNPVQIGVNNNIVASFAADGPTILGTAQRIKGDFSNATVASRVAFQSSTTNGNTVIGIIPNGTSQTSGIQCFNGTDPDNAAVGQLAITATSVGVYSTKNGSGTYLPMTFYTGGSERLRIGTDGNASMAGTLVMGSAFSFRNKIINGDFSVWQRGTSFVNQKVSGTVQYAADRWIGNRSGDVNGQDISRVAGTAGRQQYGFKWQRTSGDSSTAAMTMFYAIESANCYGLIGSYATLSFVAKAGANYSGGTLSANISYGTGTDQREYNFTGRVAAATLNQAITTTATKYSVSTSAIIPTSATQVGIRFTWTPTGTAGADDSITLEEVQLELGQTATPFESRPYGVELALCQRYYYRLSPSSTTARFGAGHNTSTTVAHGITHFPVSMRIAPSALEQTGTAAHYQVFHAATSTAGSSVPTFVSASTDSAVTTCTVASGLTAGQGSAIAAANTSAYLGWSVEL